MPRELLLPNDENEHSVKKNDEHFNTYFAQKLQMTASAAKSGDDHIELSYVRHKDNSAIKETQNFGPALPVGLKIVSGEMLDSYLTSHISREPIADFKSVRIRLKSRQINR